MYKNQIVKVSENSENIFRLFVLIFNRNSFWKLFLNKFKKIITKNLFGKYFYF